MKPQPGFARRWAIICSPLVLLVLGVLAVGELGHEGRVEQYETEMREYRIVLRERLVAAGHADFYDPCDTGDDSEQLDCVLRKMILEEKLMGDRKEPREPTRTPTLQILGISAIALGVMFLPYLLMLPIGLVRWLWTGTAGRGSLGE